MVRAGISERVAMIKQYFDNGTHLEKINGEFTCDKLPLNIVEILLGKKYNVIIICIKMKQAIWHSSERKKSKI